MAVTTVIWLQQSQSQGMLIQLIKYDKIYKQNLIIS